MTGLSAAQPDRRDLTKPQKRTLDAALRMIAYDGEFTSESMIAVERGYPWERGLRRVLRALEAKGHLRFGIWIDDECGYAIWPGDAIARLSGQSHSMNDAPGACEVCNARARWFAARANSPWGGTAA